MSTEGIRARKELGMLIKEARRQYPVEDGHLTQADLAELMDCTQSKIQKIEGGKVRIQAGTVEHLIELLRVDAATARLMQALVELNAASEPWADERRLVPSYAREYMEQEQVATEILSWHELRIPGPLQSEQYMLKQFETAGKIDVAPFLRNRRRRKHILRQSHLRRYHCILAEEALHRTAAGLGRDVARDQIDYLLAINDLNNTTLADHRSSVHLLPTDTEIAYLPGDFSLLHVADRGSLLYIEHVAGAHYLRRDAEIKQAGDAWERLRRNALDREATSGFLWKLREGFASG